MSVSSDLFSLFPLSLCDFWVEQIVDVTRYALLHLLCTQLIKQKKLRSSDPSIYACSLLHLLCTQLIKLQTKMQLIQPEKKLHISDPSYFACSLLPLCTQLIKLQKKMQSLSQGAWRTHCATDLISDFTTHKAMLAHGRFIFCLLFIVR
jgi:hypothetical protein